jgi:small subunit ribosomal protein S6
MTLNDPRPYETTYIITPDLNPDEFAQVIEKFNNILKEHGGVITNQEVWGFRKLAYTISKKNTGYYVFTEFIAPPTIVEPLERDYSYDERIIRYLTVRLDKDAVAYNEKRRAKLQGEVVTD